MKKIFLAKKGKRILARVIDVLISLIITLAVFLIFVLPNTLDTVTIKSNGEEITRLYKETGLFVVDDEGNYNANCAFTNVSKLDDLYTLTNKFNGETYTVSLTESLYIFYTTKFTDFGNEFNLTLETYNKEILKVGTEESNILSYDVSSNRLILIDSEKENVTINYFLKIYSNACKNVISNSKINELTVKNQSIVLGSLVYIIPVLIITTFIFELLIPLFSPCCETIGKHILKLGVLSHEGYRLKKGWLILRWLCYVLVELILGVLTFGATVLITYTMFLFCKKRRCLHDFVAKTCVIEKAGSIYFANRKEEEYYIKYYGEDEDSDA
jgi:uncharacterized RDD family membrane protein YckC